MTARQLRRKVVEAAATIAKLVDRIPARVSGAEAQFELDAVYDHLTVDVIPLLTACIERESPAVHS